MMRYLALFAAVASLIVGSAHAGEPLGSRSFGGAVPGNTTTTIFTGSANVAGATIRTLAATDGAGTQMFVLANYPDGSSKVVYSLVSSAGVVFNGTLPYPVDLAPGVGLSVMLTQGTAAGQLYLTYDFR